MRDVLCCGLYAGNANVERRGGDFARETADGVRQPDARGRGGQQCDAARQRDAPDPIERSKRYEHYCCTCRGQRGSQGDPASEAHRNDYRAHAGFAILGIIFGGIDQDDAHLYCAIRHGEGYQFWRWPSAEERGDHQHWTHENDQPETSQLRDAAAFQAEGLDGIRRA